MNLPIENTTSGTSFTSFAIGQNFLNAVWNDSRLVDQSAYSGDFSAFVAEAAPRFLIDPIGDVDTGWSDAANYPTGITSLTNVGGIKDVTYDGWGFGDSMVGPYRTATGAFKDGVSYSTAMIDGNSIALNFDGQAYDGTITIPPSSFQVYANGGAAAVPEPATTGLLMGLGIAALVGYKMFKNKISKK